MRKWVELESDTFFFYWINNDIPFILMDVPMEAD